MECGGSGPLEATPEDNTAFIAQHGLNAHGGGMACGCPKVTTNSPTANGGTLRQYSYMDPCGHCGGDGPIGILVPGEKCGCPDEPIYDPIFPWRPRLEKMISNVNLVQHTGSLPSNIAHAGLVGRGRRLSDLQYEVSDNETVSEARRLQHIIAAIPTMGIKNPILAQPIKGIYPVLAPGKVYPMPISPSLSCKWSGEIANAFLAGCAAGCKHYPTLGEAKSACEQIKECGGVTKRGADQGGMYELRAASSASKQLASGESSWLRGVCEGGLYQIVDECGV